MQLNRDNLGERRDGVSQARPHEAEVEIHARASVVHLRDPAGDEGRLDDAHLAASISNFLLDRLAQAQDVGPRYTGFKRLGNQLVPVDAIKTILTNSLMLGWGEGYCMPKSLKYAIIYVRK